MRRKPDRMMAAIVVQRFGMDMDGRGAIHLPGHSVGPYPPRSRASLLPSLALRDSGLWVVGMWKV